MSTVPEQLQPIFEQLDKNTDSNIAKLAKAISFKAVSADESLRQECFKKADYIQSLLEKLNCTDIQQFDLGEEKPGLPLPPVILARLGTSPTKKTVVVYAHMDVQPASIEDGWNTEPFVLHHDKENGLLIGRGSTDDTGPLLAWLNMIEAHQQLNKELPVNLIFCFESMEESGSIGLENLIKEQAVVSGYFYKTCSKIDAVAISDNYWLGTTTPALTYGLRGCNYYQIKVNGPKADLHSGVFGGCIAEPMIDLVQLLSTLVSSQGEILIPGVKEMVAPVTEEEKDIYKSIKYSIEEFNESSNSETCLFDNKEDILMHRWRMPSLSVHGIENAFSGPGAKTVIPATCTGKFSIRTVPHIDSAKLDAIVIDHVNKEFAKLNSKNTMTCELIHDGAYWYSDPFNDSFTAASKATELVWGQKPDLTREGGSIPITLTFEEQLKSSVVLIPCGRGNDGAHSINEKIDLENYVKGGKLLGSYLYYLAE
ncbi:hypothetical protein FOG48_00405 [Hanseniaspora uvarum]|nr:hypothetical protein FOG48_00405 [Hanseniaspora uvarum]